eukprot:scaffold113980_cov24-Tisochrysis_lutea.AAC.1
MSRGAASEASTKGGAVASPRAASAGALLSYRTRRTRSSGASTHPRSAAEATSCSSRAAIRVSKAFPPLALALTPASSGVPSVGSGVSALESLGSRVAARPRLRSAFPRAAPPRCPPQVAARAGSIRQRVRCHPVAAPQAENARRPASPLACGADLPLVSGPSARPSARRHLSWPPFLLVRRAARAAHAARAQPPPRAPKAHRRPWG